MGTIRETTIFQKGQVGVQSAYGTYAAATVVLNAVDLNPTPRKTIDKFTPKGYTLPTVVANNQEFCEVMGEGRLTYEMAAMIISGDLTLPLFNIVSDVAIEAADVPLYTIEAGGLAIRDCVPTGWTIKGSTSEISISTSFVGGAFKKQTATSGLTPTDLTPVLNDHVSISIDGDPITNAFEWELALSNIWAQAFFVGDNVLGGVVQAAVEGSFNIKWEADSDNVTRLTETDTVPIIITMTDGAQTITITFDGVPGEPQAFSDEGGVYACGMSYVVVNKETTAVEVAIS